jgi:lipopolysaccharide export system protein LptA
MVRQSSKYTFVFLLLFFVVLPFSLFAQVGVQEKMATLYANQITYEDGKVIAKGNVIFIDQDITMKTCVLIYDVNSGIVQSEGPVVFEQAGSTMNGASLAYNVKTGEADILTASGQIKNLYIQGEPLHGILFFTAESIQMEKGAVFLHNTNVTTCDFPEGQKHYHISAKRVEVYPGDKMIIFHGRLWIGKTPLWEVGKIVIDLHPHPKRQSYFPRFGYDSADGVFIRTVTDFLAYDSNYGAILLDYYQKTGLAAGIVEPIPLGTRGGGELHLYHQNSNNFQHVTRDQDTLNLNYNFGSLSATASFSFFRYTVPPISSPDNISANFGLSRGSSHYSWSITGSSNITTGYTNSQNLQYHRSQDFGRGLTLDFTENYIRTNLAGISNDTLHNLTILSQKFAGWTASFIYEKTDSTLFDAGFLNRTPELDLKSDLFTFEPLHLPYQISMSFADDYESFQKLKALHYDFQLVIPPQTYKLGKDFTIQESALYQQDFYDTGNFYPTQRFQARYLLGDETRLSASIADHFDAMADYRSQSNIGFDPFVFDAFPPFRTLSFELSAHNQDFWRVDIGSAYDFKNKFYQQLVARIDLRPQKDWYFHLDGFYDPNLKHWNDVIFLADFWIIPESLTNGVRLQYWADYNVPSRKIGYEDIALYKEWHDFEARLIYTWQQRQIFLFFNLKAFPEQQVVLGINPIFTVPGANAYMLP